MREITNKYSESNCFFCGTKNGLGLKLKFYESESPPNELVCLWHPPAIYTGFGKILHGGIQSGLFDEIMGWTTMHFQKRLGVTSSLNIRFLKPLYVDQQIQVRCRITSCSDKRVTLAAEISDAKNQVCSTATGTYTLIEESYFESLIGELG